MKAIEKKIITKVTSVVLLACVWDPMSGCTVCIFRVSNVNKRQSTKMRPNKYNWVRRPDQDINIFFSSPPYCFYFTMRKCRNTGLVNVLSL
jgi:hypothetical protein